MGKVIAMPNARDWKYFDRCLTELRINDVSNIIARGKIITEAKEELDHGSFEATMKRHFSVGTAERLMTIARHPILSKSAHGPCLPPSWRTLYELSKLDHKFLRDKIADGTIHPKMERSEVAPMLADMKNTVTGAILDTIAAAKTGLTSDEVCQKIGGDVSSSTVRGVMSRLMKRGEIAPTGELRKTKSKPAQAFIIAKNPPAAPPPPKAAVAIKPQPPPETVASLDQRRDEYRKAVAALDLAARRQEMRELYRDFLKQIALDQQVEDIQKLLYRELPWKVEQFSKLTRAVTFKI